MPTLAEFILTISLRYDKEENYTSTLFQFETAQQFRLFRYKIEIEDVVDPETKRFSFEIKGIHISSTTMSGTGPAKKEKAYSHLEGEYRILVQRAKQSASFTLIVASNELKVNDEQNEDFLQINLMDTKEVTRE